MSETTISIADGALRGYSNRGIHVFKGIPYGAPSGGARRFLPPARPEPWPGVRDATEFGPSCAQPGQVPPDPAAREHLERFFGVYGMTFEEKVQSEDCLVLNVFTPALDDGKRPVMFRIHGGGFTMGSGSWGWHDGTNLAKRGDVVVVTVNHRLGILGYLDVGSRNGDDGATSSNAGMLDLVAALAWVRDNIATFGGDAGNVTIFGESGGGAKVSTLLGMPAARGLFHRAIVQSGPGLQARSPEAAAATADQIFAELGTDSLEELQAMPVERLLAAQTALGRGAGPGAAMAGFGPVRDGREIPEDTADALADGSAVDVPVIIGSTRHEATLFMGAAGMNATSTMEEDALHAQVEATLGDRTDELLAVYRRGSPDASALDLAVMIQSDLTMRRGSIRFAEQKVRGSSAPVFMYLLAWESPALDGWVRASHGMCVPLTMDNCDSAPMVGDYPAARELATYMSEAWIAFARTGDPNHSELPDWPAYSTDERATMVFDVPCRVVNDPESDARRIWTQT